MSKYTENYTAKDLLDSLEPREREKVLKEALKTMHPCVRNGHKYKTVAVAYRWFLPPQSKMVCTCCGIIKYV